MRSAPPCSMRGQFSRTATYVSNGISVIRRNDSRSRVRPAPAFIQAHQPLSACFPSGPLLDLVDVIGDETVRLSVDIGGGLGRRGLNQAEHPPALLVDPVPQ